MERSFSATSPAGERTLRIEARAPGRYLVTIDGEPIELDLHGVGPGLYSILVRGRSRTVEIEPTPSGVRVAIGEQVFPLSLQDPSRRPRQHGPGPAAEGPQRLQAPMPGKIVKVKVEPGDPVEAGTALVVIEAMKMENELRATQPGRVESVAVREGQAVEANQELLVIVPPR